MRPDAMEAAAKSRSDTAGGKRPVDAAVVCPPHMLHAHLVVAVIVFIEPFEGLYNSNIRLYRSL